MKRRITDKRGNRFNDDMIGVTGNAAISIALRNSVFKVVPASLVRRVYQAARLASLGKGGTITQKRQNAMEWFGKMGVQEQQVFDLLGVRGLDDIGEDQLITLRGLKTAIQDGETTVEQTFNPPKGRSEGAEDLNEALDAPEGGDDGKPPTGARVKQLRDLKAKVPEDAFTTADFEAMDLAVADKDGPAVRQWIKNLNKALLDGQEELL